MSTDMTLGDGVGRGALIGAAVGFVVVAILVTMVGWLAGLAPVDSVGIGAVAAVWAGPGFGAMYGAIAILARDERAAVAERHRHEG